MFPLKRITGLLSLFVCIISANNFSAVAQAVPKGPSQPNILWITCEDMSPDLPMFGDATVATPNLSNLAAEGIRYNQVYTTAGVCAPSRSALITGMYATTMGTHNMRTGSGARAGLIDYEGVPPQEVKCFPEYLRAAGYYCTNNVKTDYQFGVPFTAWDENSTKAHWRNRPAGKPFFSVFNIERTHESQIWVHKDKPLRVDPNKIKLPPYYPETPVIRRDVARYYDNIMVMDSIAGIILKQLREDGLEKNTIVFFFSDHGAGLPWYKREIHGRGLHVPLIIRFPNKQNAGTTNNDLISFIDFAPSVLSLTNQVIPKHMQGQAFLGPKKSAQPNRYIYAARDRMDELNDMARSVRDRRFHYIRNYQPEKPYYQDLPYRRQMDLMNEILRLKQENKLGPVTKRWFETKAPEELYDIQKDPYELKNLATDPAYKKEINRMREAHLEWTVKTNDKGYIPEKDLIERMWPGLKQPETADPVAETVSTSGNESMVKLSCPTTGASIGYRFDNDEKWQLYHQPVSVPKSGQLIFSSIRYGYKRSKEVSVRF